MKPQFLTLLLKPTIYLLNTTIVTLYILLIVCLAALAVLYMDWIAEKLSEDPGSREMNLSKYFRLTLYLLAFSVLLAWNIPMVVDYVWGGSWEVVGS